MFYGLAIKNWINFIIKIQCWSQRLSQEFWLGEHQPEEKKSAEKSYASKKEVYKDADFLPSEIIYRMLITAIAANKCR